MPPRPAKRPKSTPSNTSQTTPTPTTTQDKHQLFTSWAQAHGVEINGVSAQTLSGRGLGLVTTRRIKAGERILFVPEEAMFKPDFTALRRMGLERASPQAKLAVSALLKFSASESSLVAWRETWPVLTDFEEGMPLFWDEDVTCRLPASVQAPFERQCADFERDARVAQAAVQKAECTSEDFRYFWMIVNSRSFHWAPPKGGAGFMVLCPFIDYINHGPTGAGCNVMQRSDGYEVVADRKYAAGQEILATYGAHSNDKLLVHYGFILPYTADKPVADDEIRIDAQLQPLFTPAIKQQLSDVGFLGPFALIPSRDSDDRITGWEPCFKTQVALRATLLTCNEWEYFAGSGEDLSGDKSAVVMGLLVDVLGGFAEEARGCAGEGDGEKSGGMSDAAFRAARDLTRRRWRQIADAVDAFISTNRANERENLAA